MGRIIVPRHVDLPVVDMWTFLFERKSKPFPDSQPIFTCPYTNRTNTYADVRRTAEEFGLGLRCVYSFKKADVLAVFSPNHIDTPAVTWGTHWNGGIVSPANPAYTADELTFHLKDCDAKVLVTQRSLLGIATKAADNVGLSHDKIILIGEEGVGMPEEVYKGFGEILEAGQKAEKIEKGQVVKVSRERERVDAMKDLAFLVYSSGTTGRPKGVMLSHMNVVSDLILMEPVEGRSLKSGKDKILAVLPYYHIYGLSCLVHQPLHLGVESVVMPSFDLKLFCNIIQEHKITYLYVAPPIVLHLAKNPLVDDYDLSSVRMATSGAAPLSKELIFAVEKRLNLPVKQAFGLSETSPVSHMMPWDDSWKTAIGSVGPPLPNLKCLFIGADGKPVKAGQEGELWISGPNVFLGYHNNEAATKESITEDGFFKTGDIGYEDENRYMYITDRVKELIKYKGSQVAPAELEGMLLSHPLVEDVAVIGIHVEAIASEVPMAFIVSKEGGKKDEQAAKEVIEWLAERLAKTKRLRGGIVWCDEVPKSASGKILRRILKERIKDPKWEGALGAVDYSQREEKAKL